MSQMFTDENFDSDVLKSKEPVLVDFFAEWCGPCKMMAPIIDELGSEFEGKWKIGKYDVDNGGKFAEQFGVQSIPTIIFFKDGKEIDRTVGFQSKEALLKKLEG